MLAAKPGLYEQAVAGAGRKLLDEAVTEGLVTRTAATVLGRSSSSDPFVRTEALSYMPTQKGRAVFRSIDRKGYDGSTVEVPALCVATGAVDRIVRWTDPADVMGHTLTTVTYVVVAKDLVEGGSPADHARLTRPVEQTVTLQRVSDGWRVFDNR